MSKLKKKSLRIIKSILKILASITIFIVLFLGAVILLIQIPSVQLKLVSKATDYISERLKFPIKIEGLDIDWFDEIVLEGLTVEDPYKGKMIYLGEAIVDYNILSLMHPEIRIDEVTLRNGQVKLIRYAPDGYLNINEFISALQDLADTSASQTKPAPFTIPSVQLENMFFSYDDNREGRIPDFDHYHFSFDSIYGDVRNLLAVADTFQIEVNNLRTYEVKTGLKVHKLNTVYTISSHAMDFARLSASIGKSKVQNYLRFEFEDINDLSEFNDKTTVIAHLENSVVDSKNLSLFASALKPFHDKATISGDFKGKVIDFSVKNLSLAFGKHSVLDGKVKFKGLPEIEETFIEFDMNHSQIFPSDLEQYFDETSFGILNKFGKVTGYGKFIGFPNDFVANASFNTQIGKLVSDINLKINQKAETKSYYKGHLKTIGFNLGKVLDMPDKVQLIDMDGSIEGHGFSLAKAELKLDAHINRIGLNNYNYKNIVTNAHLGKKLFMGELTIKDSNLVMNVSGEVDLRENESVVDIKGRIDKAHLKALNLSSVETLLKTNVNLNFTGLQIDNIVGEGWLTNTYLLYKDNKEIFIDSLHALSEKDGNQRLIKINSDLASLTASGDFELSRLVNDFEDLLEEYKLNVNNTEADIIEYYKRKNLRNIKNYNVDFSLSLEDINSILSIYVPEIFLSKGVEISGNFSNGKTTIFNVNTKFDTLYYKGNEFYNTTIELSSSKIADKSNALAMVYVTSEKQKIEGMLATENFYFQGVWNEKQVDFETNIKEWNSNNLVELKGNIHFLADMELLIFKDSKISLLDKVWKISEDNKIFIANKEFLFENFTIANAEQSLTLNGTISDNQNKEALLLIKDFQMETINPLLGGNRLKGLLNGSIVIKDIYKDLDLDGNIKLDGFYLDGFYIGNITGQSNYNPSTDLLDVKVDVERLNFNIINVEGYIKPSQTGENEKINLVAKLNNADLEILTPLLGGFLTKLSGKVTGKFNITGTTKNPAIVGAGDVQKGKFTIPYLGVTYFLDDKIYMDENLIGFKKLKLSDTEGNVAYVDGGIYHDAFKDFIVNIKGKMANFNVLNTTEKDNKLFYGTGFVTGDVELLGGFSNLQINAHAKTNRGTKFFIPINDHEELEQQSYIRFVSKKSKDTIAAKTNLDLSGLKLNFNFEITPDAYGEIIFDKKAGDIIRGNGQGNLKLVIDTRGDFYMYGDYRITKGAYNFTLAGLINKEFKIQPNSSISWTGDPYAGIMDIKAIYEQSASLAPLIIDTLKLKQPQNVRRYPINVLLGLEGELLKPKISLDIDIVKFPPDLSGEVTLFETNIKTNEQLLNKQVFSLLVLRSLSPDNGFTGVQGNSTNNLSELLSNQLSNWLSQVDENLQIDVNLNGMDKQALNTFQLRLSYNLLDGRLRITREGSFQNVQNSQQASLTNIAGEWTLEYLLSSDGKFRLKLFNRANQNTFLTSLGYNTSTSAGFSLLHTQNFDNLKDLFSKKAKVSNEGVDHINKEIEEYRKKRDEEEKQQIEDEKKKEQDDKKEQPDNKPISQNEILNPQEEK